MSLNTHQTAEAAGTGKQRLERLKKLRDQAEDTQSRVARALIAVASIGVHYDNIDPETWKTIVQHPDLEGF